MFKDILVKLFIRFDGRFHKRTLQFVRNSFLNKIMSNKEDTIEVDAKTKEDYKNKYGNNFIFEINKRDEMYQFLVAVHIKKMLAFKEYLGSGEMLFLMLEKILKDINYPFHKIGSFLDFASGYGRLTRFVIQSLDRKKITVSDIDKNAVDFNMKIFGVSGFYSTLEANELNKNGKYDVVLVASLFSHLSLSNWKEWFKKLFSMLNKNGILIITTHGDYLLDELDKKKYKIEKGFYFRKINETQGRLPTNYYGTAYVDDDFVRNFINSNLVGKLIKYYQKELWACQDVYVIQN